MLNSIFKMVLWDEGWSSLLLMTELKKVYCVSSETGDILRNRPTSGSVTLSKDCLLICNWNMIAAPSVGHCED